MLVLKDYQKDGVKWLLTHHRALLADDMGLGKTIQVIAAIERLRVWLYFESVVICPASLVRQWEIEIERFSELRVGRDIHIFSYDMAMRHPERVRAIKAAILVLDEAQRIKNASTKTSRAMKELGDYEYKWVVTGTPLENRIEDIQSLLEFLDCKCDLKDVDIKAARKVLDGIPHGNEIALVGHSCRIKGLNVKRLKKDIDVTTVNDALESRMLRRMRADVLDDLPPRTDKTYEVMLGKEARKAYAKWERRLKAGLDDKDYTFTNALDALQKLRQICIDPQMVGEKGASPKMDELVEIVMDAKAQGRKAVVFTEYRRAVEIARLRLENEGLACAFLHGGVKCHEAEKARLKTADVMLCTRTGELGHNLQDASVVINLDLPYNPARLDQRIARCHRKGQTQCVQVVNIVAPHTIEDRILQILATKRALFEKMVNKPARNSWRKWMRELV